MAISDWLKDQMKRMVDGDELDAMKRAEMEHLERMFEQKQIAAIQRQNRLAEIQRQNPYTQPYPVKTGPTLEERIERLEEFITYASTVDPNFEKLFAGFKAKKRLEEAHNDTEE